MQKVGMTWRVDPEHWAAYREIHLHPWPELLSTMQACGVRNCNIFAFGTRCFMYWEIEAEDGAKALAALAATEVKQRWDAQVTAWVLPEAEEGSGAQFMDLERIFYCP